MTICSFEPELNLDEWTQTLLKPLEGERYPLSASIELTDRCNYACRHCFINQPAGSQAIQALEPTTDQWKGILKQIADAGCLFLLLSGGEPLLRPDFPELFITARELGMIVSLFTNGSMLTPKMVDLLAGYGLYGLEISLYGATRETYEKVTRIPGSFERCIQGIALAQERGLRLNLKSVLLTINIHELEQMQALSESFGLSFRYDTTLWPRVDGDLTPLEYQIPFEKTLEMDLKDPQRREGWEETARQFEGQSIRRTLVYSCGAAYRSFHIDAYGRLTPCTMVRQPAINLLETPFDSAWEELGKIRTLKRIKHTECETCDINALCTQCPGWSLAIHGDLETPVEFICLLSKNRVKLLLEKTHSDSPGG
jgi:radical SAM protein with 4Fe4S-binding SPASM domain